MITRVFVSSFMAAWQAFPGLSNSSMLPYVRAATPAMVLVPKAVLSRAGNRPLRASRDWPGGGRPPVYRVVSVSGEKHTACPVSLHRHHPRLKPFCQSLTNPLLLALEKGGITLDPFAPVMVLVAKTPGSTSHKRDRRLRRAYETEMNIY